MKLFVWTNVEALRNFGDGQVIVMANDVAHAREVVRGYGSDAVASEIDATEPDEFYEQPVAILIQGSD